MVQSERPTPEGTDELAHHRDGGRAALPQRRLRADGETNPESTYVLRAGGDGRETPAQVQEVRGPSSRRAGGPSSSSPPPPHLPSREGSLSLGDVDVASCRQLDRGTLYHALLTKLGWSHPNSNGRGQGETARRQTVRRAPQRDCVVAEGGPEPGVPAGVKREARRGRPRRG